MLKNRQNSPLSQFGCGLKSPVLGYRSLVALLLRSLIATPRPSIRYHELPSRKLPLVARESLLSRSHYWRLSCRTVPLVIFVTVSLLLTLAARDLSGDTSEASLSPGLIAHYREESGASAQRLDERVAFDWRKQRPDPRIPSGPFEVEWQGRLRIVEPGPYRIHVYFAGSLELRIDGRLLLQAERATPGWISTPEQVWEFGTPELEILFRQANAQACCWLAWSGPSFSREIIDSRWLVHQKTSTHSNAYENGRLLADVLRCGHCHAGMETPPSVPSLKSAGEHLSTSWIADWLEETPPSNSDASARARRMPYFGLTREDAESLAAYLTARDQPQSRPASHQEIEIQFDRKLLDEGRLLFHTLGCLACHQLDSLGTSSWHSGGDLSAIGNKRSYKYLERWLRDPAELNPNHRMPVFVLSHEERLALAAFLATRRTAGISDVDETTRDPEWVARGKLLFQQHRCGACHEAPDGLRKPLSIAFPSHSGETADCLGEPALKAKRLGYRLPEKDRKNLAAYLRETSLADDASSPLDTSFHSRTLLARFQCQNCHARNQQPGISDHVPELLERLPALAPFASALAPPALTGIGDKLRPAWLHQAVQGKAPRRRPWLKVRMPKFRMTEDEARQLAEYFHTRDALPAEALPEERTPHDFLVAAGRRLVTADGFGCTSCHAVGDVQPHNVALNALGPDLSGLEQRVRRPWYERWVRHPARMVPGMEMPSVQIPIAGVLDDDLGEQIAAVWHVLNEPGFRPPQARPVRVVRQRNMQDGERRAYILTDVVVADNRTWVKPFIIGLPQRHNFMYDLAEARWSGWWLGDTASQRTQGKQWHWEISGTSLLSKPIEEPEIVLMRDNNPLKPLRPGQFFTEVDSWGHVPGGVAFTHRLLFEDSQSPGEPVWLHVRQEIVESASGGELSSIARRMSIQGLLPGITMELRLPRELPWIESGDALPDAHTWGEVKTVSSSGQLDTSVPCIRWPTEDGSDPCTVELQLRTRLPLDRFTVASFPPKARQPESLPDIVPGFEAVQLGLDPRIMPTGFAWRDNGGLLIASLKGRVWLAEDVDGDGLEETLKSFSDELAAPYGLQAGPGFVDVITKYALLRLWDEDGDGRADRTQTVASGWGHTDDYHDWAVGLPRDGAGGYYLALPCQQDDRSVAAAHLRGKLLRLVPREPTPEDPRPFQIVESCGGLRFPMGLARNAQGDLFATDNQGNYNPFNELNHLQPGKRYGFINRLENVPGFRPPETPPAVALPHPWTRSVNGICFLDPPNPGKQKSLSPDFGPFTGHLVGCEYDNRRLFRMSLEQVEETYQGAVYPFSLSPGEKTGLQGPVVCRVSPKGDLYVGSMRDSGWGAGMNTGSVVRLRYRGNVPAGIAEIHALPDGFHLRFTQPVEVKKAEDLDNYAVASFRRISTPKYGGDDVDRRTETPRAVRVDEDAQGVRLTFSELRPGFVYEFRLRNLAGDGKQFFPAEAYYTLHKIPAR